MISNNYTKVISDFNLLRLLSILYKFPYIKGCFSIINTFDLYIVRIIKISKIVIKIIKTYSIIIRSFIIFICKVSDSLVLFNQDCLIF